ncbi:MAG: hypothetical protein M3O02_11195 [Acidobacteriota bacterium]|nr:hypothetical protein [Acidobacteriota bacterium]
MEQKILERVDLLVLQTGQLVEDGKLLRMELLGGVNGETKHGRLPRLEDDVDEHERRIKKLEIALIRWKAFTGAAAGIGAVVGSVTAFVVDAGLRVFMGRH